MNWQNILIAYPLIGILVVIAAYFQLRSKVVSVKPNQYVVIWLLWPAWVVVMIVAYWPKRKKSK